MLKLDTQFTPVVLLLVYLMGCSTSVANTRESDMMTALEWHHRVLLVFAPSDNQQQLDKQLSILRQDYQGLMERHMLVGLIVADSQPTLNGNELPEMTSAGFRKLFGIEDNDYAVVLVGKDGGVKLRENRAVELSELFELVDSMPMRKSEMKARWREI